MLYAFPKSRGPCKCQEGLEAPGSAGIRGNKGGGNLGNKLVSGFCRKGKARQGERVRVG